MLLLTAALSLPNGARASASRAQSPRLIQPAQLAKLLSLPKAARPVILHVGFRVLYEQAHIPGAEYMGAASEAAGLARLRARLKTLPKDTFVVLYCGCCPWGKCPNIRPAYAAAKALGFANVKALQIARNFGADWVDQGYPVASSGAKP